jgi:hypothetical protein
VPLDVSPLSFFFFATTTTTTTTTRFWNADLEVGFERDQIPKGQTFVTLNESVKKIRPFLRDTKNPHKIRPHLFFSIVAKMSTTSSLSLDARSPVPLSPKSSSPPLGWRRRLSAAATLFSSARGGRGQNSQNALAFHISKISLRDTKRGRGRVGVVVEAKVAEKLPKSAMIEGRQLPTTTDGDIGIYGAIAPFENVFDPLGLSRRIPWEDLKRYREAELTHGRVCMLAAVGILVGEYVEGSSFLFDASITGPAINHFQQVPPPFWYALGVAIFVAEATRVQKGWADPFTSDLFTLREDYVPGEIGFDPLGLCPDGSDELYLDYKLKELSHGRLAMVATAWFVCKELLTGNKIFPQFDLFPYQ